MNIFIVGPEGSGKTVFATMLNDYISNNPECELVFRAGDASTKKYFAKMLGILQDGEWPGSTAQGKLESLAWEWDIDGNSSKICLIDPPGQDIRSELLEETNGLSIIEKIRNADIVILIVDLHGHKAAPKDKKIENAWIIEHVLMLITNTQNLIFAISKADILKGTVPDRWNDREGLMGAVAQMMPEFNQKGYREILNNCTVLAFSAVETMDIPKSDNSGTDRIPLTPLITKGLDIFVQGMKEVLRQKRERDRNALKKREHDEMIAKIKKVFKILVPSIVAIIILISIVRGCTPQTPQWTTCSQCGGSGKITIHSTCSTCGGDGKINDDDWIPFNTKSCPSCGGGGNVSNDEKCSSCGGKGKIKKQ